MMNQNELKHYGVLGMKWGVRHNPSRAFRKASRRARRLDKKALRKEVKADKLAYKADKKMIRATSERQYKKARQLEFDAKKAKLKASRVKRKSANWERRMARAFYNVSISDIKESDLQIGREYAHLLGEKKVSSIESSTDEDKKA